MSITVTPPPPGAPGPAPQFARAPESRGTAAAFRREEGKLRYEYFQPLQDEKTVLLIDSWESQQALDVHHASPMMQTIAALRDKYDLHMRVERYVSADETTQDDKIIRKKAADIEDTRYVQTNNSWLKHTSCLLRY